MNQVHILTIAREFEDSCPETQITVYGDMECALNAYSLSVDEARVEAEDYEFAHEDSEICTDSYRYFRIEDLHSCDRITIEVETKEVIESVSDDI